MLGYNTSIQTAQIIYLPDTSIAGDDTTQPSQPQAPQEVPQQQPSTPAEQPPERSQLQ